MIGSDVPAESSSAATTRRNRYSISNYSKHLRSGMLGSSPKDDRVVDSPPARILIIAGKSSIS